MDNKRQIKKDIFFHAIIPIFAAILGIVGTCITQERREESLVKSMSGRYENVEENMELEQALELVFEEKKELEKNIDNIFNKHSQLESKLDEMSDADVYSPSLIIEGLKQDSNIGNGVVDIDGNIYFSSEICTCIWGRKPIFDKSKNTVYYNTSSESTVENKVDLIKSGIIYDGLYLTVYKPSDGEQFSMGSDTFNKGFTLGADNYSLFGEGNGYALFDLKEKYSKLHINVARVNRDDLEIENATLKVYLNGEYTTEYDLSGQKPPTSITIDLNYSKDLKLELCGSKVVYGFAECTLEKWEF